MKHLQVKEHFLVSVKRIKYTYEIVGYCEKDEVLHSIWGQLIHNVSENLNGWDITNINPNELPDFDIFTHGSPCTSLVGQEKRMVLIRIQEQNQV